MGQFYVSITIRTSDRNAVVAALNGRTALVTPAQGGCVVVADEEADEQDQEVILSIVQALSSRLGCPALAILNHDDDILWYCLSVDGETVDEYNSSPDYFNEHRDEDDAAAAPEGGDAELLCAAFGSSQVDRVRQILQTSDENDDTYTFASDRHADLVAALGLPTFSIGFGYDDANEGDLPDGLTLEDLIRVT